MVALAASLALAALRPGLRVIRVNRCLRPAPELVGLLLGLRHKILVPEPEPVDRRLGRRAIRVKVHPHLAHLPAKTQANSKLTRTRRPLNPFSKACRSWLSPSNSSEPNSTSV